VPHAQLVTFGTVPTLYRRGGVGWLPNEARERGVHDGLAGRWAGDVKDYERVKEHLLAAADTLTTGIVSQ
jgi:hypothetical protein